MMRHLFFLFLCTTLVFSTVAKAEVSPALFASDSKYFAVKISPDGQYLAVGMNSGGKRKLVILDSKKFKPVGGVSFPGKQQVGNFHWVNDERLVIQIVETRPWLSEPIYVGELFAVNYDGKKGELIYGLRAGGSSTSTKIKQKKSTRGWATIIDTLPDDEEHILIASEPHSVDQNLPPFVHMLNVYNGRMKNAITRAPLSDSRFIPDHKGGIKYVYSVNKDYESIFYQFNEGDDSWQAVESIAMGSRFMPLGMDMKAQNLYFYNDHQQDKRGLFKLNVNSQKVTHLYTDKNVDISDVIYSNASDVVYALRIDNGYPEYLVFNKHQQEADIFKSVLAAFPGLKVNLTSSTRDGNKWVVLVSSDTSPGTFYLYDKQAGSMVFLFKLFDSVPEKELAESVPIKFAASDGMQIHGYLTKPAKAKKDAPLVTLVHGGPHGVRDVWAFDPEVQMLASQGYAVLQVNYRGSGGYGIDFEKAGYEQWGERIQQDIIDGTRWALGVKGIDSDKACIMGASFGGYSALQASTLAPDLFDCAVANVGVYDLEMMFTEGDIPDAVWGEAFLQMILGLDKEKLKAYSPVQNVAKLKAPLLIAHGEKDQRVPIEQALALKKELDKHDKAYEWFVKPTETHGFHDPKNRAEYYEKVAVFLSRHLQ